MGKEIERKFLLKPGASIPIPAFHSKMRIKQGYLGVGKDNQIRVRITKFGKESKSEIGIKFIKKIIRDEFEYEIPLSDGNALYKKCNWIIEKNRLSFSYPTVHYDIDSFPNGMQWIEVEFKSIKSMKEWEKNKPSWIGKEITGVRKYSNITLAKQKLRF